MKVLSKQDIQADLSNQTILIDKIVKSIESKNSKHAVGDRLGTATPLEFLYVYTHLISKEQDESPLRKLFIDYFQSLETAFPTGAYIGAKALLSEETIGWTGPNRISSDCIFQSLRDLVGHEAFAVVSNLIKSGALYRPVIWDAIVSDGYVIEAGKGSSIKVALDGSFANTVNSGETISKGIVIVCDSVFEKMSEIDNLARGSIDENIPVFIVARGFLPDVSFTLSHNYSIGRSKIIPCVIESSDLDPFEMMDVSRLLGTEVVPGPISVFTWEQIKSIGAEILNSKLIKGRVEISSLEYNAISDLIDQVTLDDRDELSNERRASRILGNAIRLRFHKNSNDISKSRIKKGLKLYRQWAKNGVCVSDLVESPVTPELVRKVQSSSQNLKKQIDKMCAYVRIDNGMEKKMAVS